MARGILASVIVSTALVFSAPQVLAQATAPAMPPPSMPNSPAPLQPGDAFGEQIEMPDRTIIYFKGSGTWDKAFETIADAFKSLNQYLDKQGIKPNGSAMTIYTKTDNAGFNFQVAFPIAAAPKNPPKGDIAVGKAPSGKALKFTHRGSFDALDTTYEAITNHLDEKRLEAHEIFIEDYGGEAIKNAEDNLIVTIFVPIK